MSDKITQANLDNLVDLLNTKLKRPLTPYKMNKKGVPVRDKETNRLKPNKGHYCLYSAYGKIGLDQMTAEGGAERIFGLCTKRELFNQIHAFLKGVRAVKGERY
jgi:hypothetical protein